jgi:hypothetical protein
VRGTVWLASGGRGTWRRSSSAAGSSTNGGPADDANGSRHLAHFSVVSYNHQSPALARLPALWLNVI